MGKPGPAQPAYLRSVRRLLVLVLLGSLGGCAYDPGPVRPGVTGASGITGPTASQQPTAPTGPTGTAPTFTAEGCPVDDPGFCEEAAFLANALVLGDADAVLQRFRLERYDCRDLDPELFPQCAEDSGLKGRGYLIGTHLDEFFVQEPDDFAETLFFFVESVDPEYQDELGGSAMRILGVSTCGSAEDTSHHVVYLVGLKDPESTLPGDRFLGTYEFVEREGAWQIGATYVGLYTDWQLVLDDPLADIACGDVLPWQT